ncbi:glycosyltransferase [Cetobacterium sp. SF1]|uniref:glycosyltransferase n=1 Tax=Cetobacterium sp. SF1 TaxID=3417654 RepID=UPI003CE6DCA6
MTDILIISDNNEPCYKENLFLYNYVILSKSMLIPKDFKVAIIDLDDKKEIIDICNSIRLLNSSTPIVIISNFKRNFDYDILLHIRGEGIIRILLFSENNKDVFVNTLDSLLDLSYSHDNFQINFIIPIYNEEQRFKNVINFTKKITYFIENNYPKSKIIFVNDGSKDKSKVLIENLIQEIKTQSDYISDRGFLGVRTLEENTKKAGTYIEGLKIAQGDIIIIVDGDDSFYIEDIGKIINVIREGYFDCIFGTKDLTAENRPPIRRALSFFKRILTKGLLPKNVYDSQTGLKGLKGDVAKYILPHLSQKRELAIDLEMGYLAKYFNLRVLQLPVQCIDREGSHIQLIKDSISYIKNIISITFTKYDFRR